MVVLVGFMVAKLFLDGYDGFRVVACLVDYAYHICWQFEIIIPNIPTTAFFVHNEFLFAIISESPF